MVLDHLIAVVPDLRATHARLQTLGFAEAWPPGPFWPAATTSGLALGGANLELIQPDAGVASPHIETLVLAPSTLEEGRAYLDAHRLAYAERAKVEPNPGLLTLRGFPPEAATTPQEICTNLYPEAPTYPFFLCRYAPFLEERLAPNRFPAPRGPLIGLRLVAPDAEGVRRLFAGSLGPIELDVEIGPTPGVASIHFADGSVLTAGDLR